MKIILDKDSLIRRISDKGSFTISDSYVFLDSLIEVIKECLENGEEINVRGFLKIYVQNLPPRKGSSLVSDGKELPPAKRVIAKLSKDIRELVKG